MGNDKKDFLFRFLPNVVRGELQFDNEALYSTTDQLTAEKICKDLLKVVPASATVTDATACIGGSSYSLSKVFAKVNAIEMDDTRFSYLCNNMNKLKVTDTVSCFHGDALDICKTLEQDLIFIDPPWGGPEYKSHTKLSLQLSGHDISEVCIFMLRYARFVAIKVPKNFDEETFQEKIKDHATIVLRNTNLRKMHLLVVQPNRRRDLDERTQVLP